jgi:late competence protein required for DNA uptake (superfamily II DNA/RNA helicase)
MQDFKDHSLEYGWKIINNRTDKNEANKNTQECDKHPGITATHVSNFMGSKKYRCEPCAKTFMQKNSQLPASLYFCKTIQEYEAWKKNSEQTTNISDPQTKSVHVQQASKSYEKDYKPYIVNSAHKKCHDW